MAGAVRPALVFLFFLAAPACRAPGPPDPASGTPGAPGEPLREAEPATPPPLPEEAVQDAARLAEIWPQEPLPEGEGAEAAEAAAPDGAAQGAPQPVPLELRDTPEMRSPHAEEEGAKSEAVGAGDTSTDAATATATATDAGIAVTEAVLAAVIDGKSPSGVATSFAVGARVHCYTVLENPSGAAQQIRHIWYRDGERRSTITLSVRGRSWRTWSNNVVSSAGSWRVDVLDSTGKVLRSLPFLVE